MVDELFLMKKLKDVEFKDFDEAILDFVKEQNDYDRIVKFYGKEEIQDDDGNMVTPLEDKCTMFAGEVFKNPVYQFSSVRGAVNAVITLLRGEVYEQLGEQQVLQKIEDGQFDQVEGIVLGAYDYKQPKKAGGSFQKQFMAVLTPDSQIVEISNIEDKIGTSNYGVKVPFNHSATIAYEPKKFKRANGNEDVDYAAKRVLGCSDDAYSSHDIFTILKDADITFTTEELIDALPPNGNLTLGSWFVLNGITRELQPFPVFVDRQKTNMNHPLVVPDRDNVLRYSFNLVVRGKMEDRELFYPTVRMQPIEVGHTNVEYPEDLKELVTYLEESRDMMTPEQQIEALSNNVVDREFYALVKLVKIEQRQGTMKRDDKEIDVDRFYINLNAVLIWFTEEIVPFVPQKRDEPKTEGKEEKPKATKPKKAASVGAQMKALNQKDWKPEVEQEIKNWLGVMGSDTTFENLQENDVFADFSDVPEAALRKVFDDIKGKIDG